MQETGSVPKDLRREISMVTVVPSFNYLVAIACFNVVDEISWWKF